MRCVHRLGDLSGTADSVFSPLQHLKAIIDALQSHVSPPKDGTDRINYDDFCTVRDIVTEITPLAAPYFTATAFLKVRGVTGVFAVP
jgi:hypothetical protein